MTQSDLAAFRRQLDEFSSRLDARLQTEVLDLVRAGQVTGRRGRDLWYWTVHDRDVTPQIRALELKGLLKPTYFIDTATIAEREAPVPIGPLV
jgi:hypothetical protein